MTLFGGVIEIVEAYHIGFASYGFSAELSHVLDSDLLKPGRAYNLMNVKMDGLAKA